MDVEFDPAKNAWNIKERKLAFDRAGDLDWTTAFIHPDSRMEYGEQRWIALGFLEGVCKITHRHLQVFALITESAPALSKPDCWL